MTDKYIPKDCWHIPAFIDSIYNPKCALTEEEANFMLQKKQE